MPLDGIYIYSLLDEFRKKLLNSRVDKISQPEKDEIILGLRGERVNYKLLISASSVYPKLHLTDYNKPNPPKAPMFCMVLRKYLSTAKIIDIYQISTDRIVFFDFESTDELGFNSIYSLVIEIMGRHSNITLVRKRDNMVIDCIKHITLDMSSFRQLYPGTRYVLPPESNKLNPFNFTFTMLQDYIENNKIKFDDNMFSKVFTGVSSQFSKSVFLKLKGDGIELQSTNLDKINISLLNIFNAIKKCEFEFFSYLQNNSVKDFYCFKLYALSSLDIKEYTTPSKLLEDYYYEKDKNERLNTKSSDLQKIIHNNLDRCNKKMNILKESLKECEDKDFYRICGDLLTSNIYNLKKGSKEIRVLNYYSEVEEYVNIELDENKTPSENIQAYYKKYNKLKKTAEMAEIQVSSNEDEIKYLQSVLVSIKNSETYEDIEECKKELIQSGYIKFKKSDKRKDKPAKPLHFLSSDGIDLYVGKNNIQNDYLTLKFAEKHDIWLHTKNIPGSHVIIKGSGKLLDKTLEEAAILAAYYSKAKDSAKVPVDYTEVKNVKKPSGAKPGMVIYYTNKTIYVDPVKLELKEVK